MFLCVYDTVLINSNKKKNQNTVNSDVNIEELSHRWYTVWWLGLVAICRHLALAARTGAAD